MVTRLWVLALASHGLLLSIYGQSAYRIYVNEYLYLGAGGEGMAQGNAFVARARGTESIYWSGGAGLHKYEGPAQIIGMYSSYFGGIVQYLYLGFSRKLHNVHGGSVGFALLRTGVDNIPNTLYLVQPDGSLDFNAVTPFSSADYAFLTSYGQSFKNFNIGGTVKILHRKAGTFASAWGFGMDVGVQGRYNKWRWAVVGKDITGTFTVWRFSFTEEEKFILESTGNIVPDKSWELATPRFIAGISRKWMLKSWLSVEPELDLVMTTDGKRNVLLRTKIISIEPLLGVSIGFADIGWLRLGAHTLQRLSGWSGQQYWSATPTLGAGIRLGTINIDYALLNVGSVNASLPSHVVSIKYTFVYPESAESEPRQ